MVVQKILNLSWIDCLNWLALWLCKRYCSCRRRRLWPLFSKAALLVLPKLVKILAVYAGAAVVLPPPCLCIFPCWHGSLCSHELMSGSYRAGVMNCFFALLGFGWIMFLNWLPIEWVRNRVGDGAVVVLTWICLSFSGTVPFHQMFWVNKDL